MALEEDKNIETSISTYNQSTCSDNQNVQVINSSPYASEELQAAEEVKDGSSQDHKEEKCCGVDKEQCQQLGVGDNNNNNNDNGVDNKQYRGGTMLSKKASKRLLKIEKVKEYRKRKKEMEKEIKRSKAVALGRNVEEEEERIKIVAAAAKGRVPMTGGENKRNRETMWNEKFKHVDTSSFRVCIDCAYDDLMTDKEIKSLAQQIRYCYAQNKRSSHPCQLIVSNLTGKTLGQLQKESGFPNHWLSRGFVGSDKSLMETFPNDTNSQQQQQQQLVYLTSDSPNILEQLSDDTVYVIGGIVDRNRLKRVAITQAERLGLPTAKLPIDQYIKLSATKVLTCNHVFQILLKYREHGNVWKKALVDVLPQRKNIQEIPSDDDDDCVQVKD